MSDILERQIFDMNCSDCKYMERSLSRRQGHVDFHYKMQKDLFDTKRIKLIEKGEKHLRRAKKEPHREKYFKEKAKKNFNEARKMQFIFSEGSCSLFYGKCTIKNKNISFIPDTVMEENFNCFEHRRS